MKVGQLLRENMVEVLREGVENQDSVFMLSYSNVSGLQMSDLRKDLGRLGAKLFISKNSMAKRALNNLDFNILGDKVEGQTAFVWGDADSAELSKILTKFAEKKDGVILQGGLLQGAFIEEEDIKRLADLPSREVLLAMLFGAIQSPLSRLAGVLNGKTRELLSLLKQLSEKKGGE